MENEVVKSAVAHISQNDMEFARKMQKTSVFRAILEMLQEAGYDLQALHKSGDLRAILGMFL
jgi:hypothetical protein